MLLTSLLDLASLKQLFVYDETQPLLFHTGQFLLLFLVFMAVYLLVVNRKPWRVAWVLAFSLFFYYKSSGIYVLLLLLSSLIDFMLGLLIYKYQREPGALHEARVLGIRLVWEDFISPLRPTPHFRPTYPEPEGGWRFYVYRFRYMIAPRLEDGLHFIHLLMNLALSGIDRLTHFVVSPDRAHRKQRFYLVLSLMANLGILAYFKYTNFFIDSLNNWLGSHLTSWDVPLLVGISFFTFQTMSYTIDIYRQKLKPVGSIMDFAFFVSFFPQLVSGPIVRAAQFLPQIRADIQVSKEDVGRAFLLICTGLFKKAVISDFIAANFVNGVFEVPALHTGFENLMAVYGYALQIYCDFSGYSDMAIGMGLLLGFRLPINFNAPYQSASIQEFWRRWHISLSTWLRDYLYISLGGNRRGKFRTYINLMLTMLLGGLWHGAAWRFVIWGALHGVALAADRMLKHARRWVRRRLSAGLDELDRYTLEQTRNSARDRMGEWLRQARWFMQGWTSLVLSVIAHLAGMIFTFHFVCFCWIFFRAETFETAWAMVENIYYNFNSQVAWQVFIENRAAFLFMLLGYVLHFLPYNIDLFVEKRFVNSPLLVKSLIVALFLWMVILVQSTLDTPQKFIYYQF